MFATIGQLFTEPRATLERLHAEGNVKAAVTALVVSLVIGCIFESLFMHFFGYMMDIIRMPVNDQLLSYTEPIIFAKLSIYILVETVLAAGIIAFVYHGVINVLGGKCDRQKFLATDFWAMAAVNWVFVVGIGILLGFAAIGFMIYQGFLLIGAWLSLMIFILFLSVAFFYYYLVAKVSTDLPNTKIVIAMVSTLVVFIVMAGIFGVVLLKLLPIA